AAPHSSTRVARAAILGRNRCPTPVTMQTIKERTRAGLLVAALVFIGIGAGVLYGAQRLITDARLVAHSNEVIGRLDELEARLRDAESAQRAYILTGRVDYLADYRNSREQVPALVGSVADLVADNRSQAALARQLRAQTEIRLHQITNTLLRNESDGLPGARAAMGSEVFETSSTIRSIKTQMTEAESTLLERRAASTATSANVLRAIAVLGIPLGLALILAVYLLLVREIARRAAAEAEAREVQARLREGNAELEHRSGDLRALSRYGSMLQSCVGPDEALQLTMRMLSTLRPGTAGTLYRMRNSKDHAEAALQWGEHRATSAASMQPASCWALRRDQPHLSPEAAA